jgi:hypothetical protein
MKLDYGISIPSELQLVNKIEEIKIFLEKEYDANIYYGIFNNNDVIGVILPTDNDKMFKLDVDLMNEFPSKHQVFFEKLFGFLLNIWSILIQDKTKYYMEQQLSESEIDEKMKSLIMPDSLDVNWFVIDEN